MMSCVKKLINNTKLCVNGNLRHLRRNRKPSLVTYSHAINPHIPAFDDLSNTCKNYIFQEAYKLNFITQI